MFNLSKVPTEAYYVLLAVAGGAANYLSRYLKGADFDLRHFLAHVFVSGFSGLMFAQFAAFIGLQGELQFMFAGVGGFMGTKAVEHAADRILERSNSSNSSKGDNATKQKKARRKRRPVSGSQAHLSR